MENRIRITLALAAICGLSLLATSFPTSHARAEAPRWIYAEAAEPTNKKFTMAEAIDISAFKPGWGALLTISFETALKCVPTVGVAYLKGLRYGAFKGSGMSDETMTVRIDADQPLKETPTLMEYDNGFEAILPPNAALAERIFRGQSLQAWPLSGIPAVEFTLQGAADAAKKPRERCAAAK